MAGFRPSNASCSSFLYNNTITCLAIFFLALPSYALPALAQDRGPHMRMWDGEWGWGHMTFGIVSMIVFWAAVIALAVLLVRMFSGSGQAPRASSREPAALGILEERFAKGEISREEFEERKRVLSGQAG